MLVRQIHLLRALIAGMAAMCAILLPALCARDARAAELVMLERPGCVWCARWDREIAPIYPLTDDGRNAPLRRVDITAPWPTDLTAIAPDSYTPTFILLDHGVEVARLRGYPGEAFFWPMLAEMMSQLSGADSN
ncbi:MAG: transcriptional regulator [Dongiaceae bacterium]